MFYSVKPHHHFHPCLLVHSGKCTYSHRHFRIERFYWPGQTGVHVRRAASTVSKPSGVRLLRQIKFDQHWPRPIKDQISSFFPPRPLPSLFPSASLSLPSFLVEKREEKKASAAVLHVNEWIGALWAPISYPLDFRSLLSFIQNIWICLHKPFLGVE